MPARTRGKTHVKPCRAQSGCEEVHALRAVGVGELGERAGVEGGCGPVGGSGDGEASEATRIGDSDRRLG